MPEANRLTIHILAAVATAKARGTKLGDPNPLPASRQAIATLKEQMGTVEVSEAGEVQIFHGGEFFWESSVLIRQGISSNAWRYASANIARQKHS